MFAKTIADQEVFVDEGDIVDQNRREEFFDIPKHERQAVRELEFANPANMFFRRPSHAF